MHAKATCGDDSRQAHGVQAETQPIAASRWAGARFGWLRAIRRDHSLPDTAKLVAAELADHANRETAACFPGLGTIADLIGKSMDTIKRAIRALEAAGWIVRQAGQGRGHRTRFRFCQPDGADLGAPERAQIEPDEMPNCGPKKGAEMPPQAHRERRERGASVPRKGGKNALPYNKDEPSKKQSERANTERPLPHLHAVIEIDSPNEARWNRWLAARGFPDLRTLGQRGSTTGRVGWDAPWQIPPEDGWQVAIAEKWASWAVWRMEARANV